jgi:hypothetical protein
MGFRFDSALFKSHPEFAGEVKAHVIAPGRMLVTVADPVSKQQDAVMESFLAFLASDMAKAPETIKPVGGELLRSIDRLVEGVSVRPDKGRPELHRNASHRTKAKLKLAPTVTPSIP